jgi:hypothetical protein
MAITIVNTTGKDFVFGIGAIATGAATTGATGGTLCAGITNVVSAEKTEAFDTSITAKDEDGDVVAHAFGNKKFSLSIEGYINSTATLPIAGDLMEVKGQKGKVMSATITASNENWLMIKVTGEGYSGITYT